MILLQLECINTWLTMTLILSFLVLVHILIISSEDIDRFLVWLFLTILSNSNFRLVSRVDDENYCETIGGDRCVFPFTYQRQTYFACTADDSDNGAPWCAVQVD